MKKNVYSAERHVGKDPTTFNVDGIDFLSGLRLPAWFFVGIDLLSLICEETEHVRKKETFCLVFIDFSLLIYN